MTVSKKIANEFIRQDYMETVKNLLETKGEEILTIGSNEIAIPCVDVNGDDKFLVLTFKVPTGTREGEEFDGYELAEDYARKVAEKREKAEEKARAKAEKIERDKQKREKAKAEKEARKKEAQ